MDNLLKAILLGNEKNEFNALILHLKQTERQYFLRNEILQVFAQQCEALQKPQYFFHSSTLGELMQFTHEILLDHHHCWLLLRPSLAHQEVYRVELETGHFSPMTPSALLHRRDRIVDCEDHDTFEINLEPFFNPDLTIADPRNIGQGFSFLHQFLLNKHSEQQGEWEETLFQIIHQCRYAEYSFLTGSDISNIHQFKEALGAAYQCLAQYPDSEHSTTILQQFQAIGFAAGWGNTVGRCRETLKLLERLIESPDALTLEAFLGRIPNVFSIASISVHGWVGQDNVLGKAETAGQVAYVLDQARSLEQKLAETIELAGLNHLDIEPQVFIVTRLIPECEGTQCNTKFEDIQGTQFAKILRIPFRDENQEIVPHWISKFQVWPYLTRFAEEACTELLPLLKGRNPDLILGHYSDGNLVAYRMARRLNTLHCSIAHSLEKNQHLFSNLYWQDLEEQYNFSIQFAADLITMNSSDFIVTSSQHEIFGTHDTVGQYESYQCFTLPNLFHVVNGVNLKSAKFNVVPPGVDETIFFPHSHQQKRDPARTQKIESLLFGSDHPEIIGQLENPNLRPLLTFVPLQSVKNLPGLVEAFGQHPEIRKHCNLVLITGKNQLNQAQNPEQTEIITQLHQLIQRYDLEPHICWIGHRLPSEDLGEIYRVIADRQGLLLHGAHFEAFGLTLLEAMISGLPVFTTKFGGSAEIVVPGKTGYLINPTEMEEALDLVLEFVQQCDSNPSYWQSFSDNSIHHIHSHYHWHNHVGKLLTLTRIHKYLKQDNRDRQDALNQYLEALFRLIYQNESPRSSCFRLNPTISDSAGISSLSEAASSSTEIPA
jgi:sucrose synthase